MIPVELDQESARPPSEEVPDGGPCLAELISSRETAAANGRVTDLSARFRNEPLLDAVGVVDAQGRAVGLVERTKLLLKMSQQYGYALYSRAQVVKIIDPTPLLLHGGMSIADVFERVVARPEADLYDSIVVVDDDVNFLGLVSVKQLIVHQTTTLANMTLEKRLTDRRADELEKLGDLKSKFIAHVTHELRAPVNAIIGMVDLLTHSSRAGDVGTMEEMLSLLASSATSLRSLVTNLLDLSKLEAGRMDVVVEEFDLAAMVREVAAMTRVLVGRKPVTVEVLAHEGPVALSSDPVKVKQIITNLASNAAKFTRAGQIRFEVSASGSSAILAVADSGIGIPPDRLASVFEPFVQVGDVHTRSHEGTGLGLSITARLLRLLGGEMRVDSRLGMGSIFEAKLPHLTKAET